MIKKKSRSNKAQAKKEIKKGPNIKIYCDISKCLACRSCELACATEHSVNKDLIKAIYEQPLSKKRLKISAVNNKAVSIHCQHCQDAPCVLACMSGALAKDKISGATLHNKDKCVGCWMCVMACPFGAIVRDIEQHIAVKCDLCPDRKDFACVAACPAEALFAGTKEEFEKRLKDKKDKK